MLPAIDRLPGFELIERGLADLESGRTSMESLLVLVGAPRLRRAGVAVPQASTAEPERTLYDMLQREHGDGAHSRYNALVRLLVSLERALEASRPVEGS